MSDKVHKKNRTRRSAAKRFKVTGSGRIKCKKAFHSHILTKKSPNRKRALRLKNSVTAVNVDQVKSMLPHG